MPDDTYNGLYIHKELVKGNWYGISSGPKPQTFTGNIDDDPESLRNKALVINSPSENNGKFPTSAYGHECAVLTTRYGEGVYLQNLFDTQDNIEYDRVCLNWTSKSSWRDWQRVTTEGDSSSTAAAADTRSINNETAINQINSAIGGRTANPSINSRVSSNTSSISSLNTDYNKFKNTTNSSITNLTNNIGTTKNLENNKSIKIYQGCHVINIPASFGNAAKFPFWNASEAENYQWALDHGCRMNGSGQFNAVMTVVNANADGQLGHEIHIEGMQFRVGTGFILVYDSSTKTTSQDVMGLTVSWLLHVYEF